MASKFPEERQVKLSTRKGHDMTWSCDIHGEPISFYCKEHNIPICHRCATKDHQKPCQLDDIGAVILEMGRKLEDTVLEMEETKTRLQKLDSKIQLCATSVNNHFQLVNDEANTTYEGKLKSLNDKEQDVIRVVNEEADEKIRIINEKRGTDIKACIAGSEQQLLSIKETQAKLLSDIKTINGAFVKRVNDLQSKNTFEAETLDNISCKIKRIKQDDKTLVNEAAQIIASLDESLRDEVQQDIDCIDQIQREVQKVMVVDGKVAGEHYARIDGYVGKWELVKSLDITSVFNPSLRGFISNHEIVLSSIGRDLYLTHISSGRTRKFIEGDSEDYVLVTSCALLLSSGIVCGKMRDDCTNSLDRSIPVYGRQGEVDITIPNSSVYVHVDSDRMILAAGHGQSIIYVINPADGKIVNTVTMQGKEVLGGIQALSSGNIVVKTGENGFTFISRSGEEKATIHCDDWKSSCCLVDKLTDTLYITCVDDKRDIFAVD